jgi:hypothetical protein
MNQGPYKDPPPVEERLRALPSPPSRAVREVGHRNAKLNTLLIFAGIALALALAVAAFAWGTRSEFEQRADQNQKAAAESDKKAETAIGQATGAAAAAAEANRRLKALGKPTVPVPTITPIPVPPPPVTSGLSASQVTAVRSIIANQLAGYQLPPAVTAQIAAQAALLVPKPKDGHTPTAKELQPLVAAAQAAYCADGRCTPKPGTPGEPGKDAPPVTDAQLRPLVADGVTAYCAQESKPCQGEPGKPGEPGADSTIQGPPGAAGPACPGGTEPVIKTVLTTDQPITGEKVFTCPVG